MVQRSKTLIFVILIVATLTQICTDIYTPSLPAIAQYFAADYGDSQLTITLFILGVAITNFIYGPIAEGIGRRWTMIIGVFIGLLGTAVCLLASDIQWLKVGRFVQGAGLGAYAALWRTIFRDAYSGDELASKSSYLTNAMIASVILAPFLGGYFEHYFGWRSNFFFLFVWLMLVMLVICFVYKETGQHHGKHRLNLSFMLSAYKALLTSRSFIGFALCAFLTYGGFFAWVTAGPIVLIHGAKISPVLFGWLAIINGLIIITAGNLNGKLVKRMTSRKMMQIGWLIMVVGGLLELVGYYLYGTTLYSVLIPVVIAMFGSMLIFPNSFANAFANVEHIGGYAGALYSGIQLLGGVVFSGIISHLDNSTQLPIAWVIMVSGILSFIMYKLVASKA